jgi:hypothetical protein
VVIMEPPGDRTHHCYPDACLYCCFSFGQINPPKTIHDVSVDRTMAMHHDCWNREALHQEARVTTSAAMARAGFFKL